jgi:hypothetical protein
MSRYQLNNVRFTEGLVDQLQTEVPSFHLSDLYAHTVAFGFDHLCGYFMQVITSSVDEETDEIVEEVILDLDSFFTGLKGWQLGYLVSTIHEETKCGCSDPYQLHNITDRAFLDLPV